MTIQRPSSAAIAGLALALAVAGAHPAAAAQSRAFVYATDFASGNLGDIAFGPPRVAQGNVASACSDAVLRYHAGLLYVVGRFGCDNVLVLDPANGFAPVRQFSVGNGTNPNDIVVVSPTRAYVSRYDSPSLAIVDPEAGTVTGTISLAAFADADGLPEMNRMALAGGRLFVTVQRVDRDAFFTPTDSSAVVVIDPATDTLVDCDPAAPGVQGILLPAQNPTTELVPDGQGRLLVGCTGNYGVLDGGVARIDPLALASDGLETTEAALGGDVVDVAPVPGGTTGFAVVSDASFNTRCVAWRRDTGAADGVLWATTGFNLGDAEVDDRGEVWLCDRTPAQPGVRVFDAVTRAQLTGAPLSVGLPPQDLEFDAATVLAAGDGAAGAAPGLALAGVWPQPAAGRATVRVRLAQPWAAHGAPLALEVFDLAGRRVRALAVDPPAGATEATLTWDGTDGGGRLLPPGVYPFRVAGAGATTGGRFVRVGR